MSNLPQTVNPCPFCGDNELTVSEGSTFRWRVAVCNNCGAHAPEVRHDTLAEDQEQANANSAADAVSAWNARENQHVTCVEQQEPVGFVRYFGEGKDQRLCFRDKYKHGWFPVFLNQCDTIDEPSKPQQVSWQDFTTWMHTEIPSGTIIGDPGWWASRIYSKFINR